MHFGPLQLLRARISQVVVAVKQSSAEETGDGSHTCCEVFALALPSLRYFDAQRHNRSKHKDGDAGSPTCQHGRAIQLDESITLHSTSGVEAPSLPRAAAVLLAVLLTAAGFGGPGVRGRQHTRARSARGTANANRRIAKKDAEGTQPLSTPRTLEAQPKSPSSTSLTTSMHASACKAAAPVQQTSAASQHTQALAVGAEHQQSSSLLQRRKFAWDTLQDSLRTAAASSRAATVQVEKLRQLLMDRRRRQQQHAGCLAAATATASSATAEAGGQTQLSVDSYATSIGDNDMVQLADTDSGSNSVDQFKQHQDRRQAVPLLSGGSGQYETGLKVWQQDTIDMGSQGIIQAGNAVCVTPARASGQSSKVLAVSAISASKLQEAGAQQDAGGILFVAQGAQQLARGAEQGKEAIEQAQALLAAAAAVNPVVPLRDVGDLAVQGMLLHDVPTGSLRGQVDEGSDEGESSCPSTMSFDMVLRCSMESETPAAPAQSMSADEEAVLSVYPRSSMDATASQWSEDAAGADVGGSWTAATAVHSPAQLLPHSSRSPLPLGKGMWPAHDAPQLRTVTSNSTRISVANVQVDDAETAAEAADMDGDAVPGAPPRPAGPVSLSTAFACHTAPLPASSPSSSRSTKHKPLSDVPPALPFHSEVAQWQSQRFLHSRSLPKELMDEVRRSIQQEAELVAQRSESLAGERTWQVDYGGNLPELVRGLSADYQGTRGSSVTAHTANVVDSITSIADRSEGEKLVSERSAAGEGTDSRSAATEHAASVADTTSGTGSAATELAASVTASAGAGGCSEVEQRGVELSSKHCASMSRGQEAARTPNHQHGLHDIRKQQVHSGQQQLQQVQAHQHKQPQPLAYTATAAATQREAANVVAKSAAMARAASLPTSLMRAVLEADTAEAASSPRTHKPSPPRPGGSPRQMNSPSRAISSPSSWNGPTQRTSIPLRTGSPRTQSSPMNVGSPVGHPSRVATLRPDHASHELVHVAAESIKAVQHLAERFGRRHMSSIHTPELHHEDRPIHPGLSGAPDVASEGAVRLDDGAHGVVARRLDIVANSTPSWTGLPSPSTS